MTANCYCHHCPSPWAAGPSRRGRRRRRRQLRPRSRAGGVGGCGRRERDRPRPSQPAPMNTRYLNNKVIVEEELYFFITHVYRTNLRGKYN